MKFYALATALSVALTTFAFAQAPPAKTAPRAPAPEVPAAPVEPRPSEILTDRPDADLEDGVDLLGDEWESKGNGIALRAPKGATAQKRLGSQDVVEFVNESKGINLKVSKMMLDQPGQLMEWRDVNGEVHPGVVDFTATRLKENIPDAEFVRKEQINIADGDVGVIALRFTKNLKPMLAQQAIIQKTDQLYYLIALTTPGAERGPDGKAAAGASGSERVAIEMFRQVLDSVKLLDLTAVRQDQDDRLFRTRTFLVNLTPERMRAALREQQWMRILKKGKDVGYIKVLERTLSKGNQDGIDIRIRSRMLPGGNAQIDSGSIIFASVDLRHEDWSTLTDYGLTEAATIKARAADPKYKPPQMTESGISDRRSVPGHGDVYALQVLFESTRERVDPVIRDLPPFYLPQAISHLLPRLVPTGEPKNYLFMVYVPDTREVMMRYIDVLKSEKVQFNNQLVRAVRINDRVGLEGPITTHYISSDNVWIGSENKETGITVLRSNEETLLNIWKDANLTSPEAPAIPKARQAKPQAAVDADKNAVRSVSRKPVDIKPENNR